MNEYITHADKNYYKPLQTLIKSIKKTHNKYSITIYDIGLTKKQKKKLKGENIVINNEYNTGSKTWEEGITLKPKIIQYHHNNTNKSFTYLDSDTKIVNEPVWYDGDIQAPIEHPHQWERHGKHSVITNVGVIHFKNNESSKKFIREWIKQTEKSNHKYREQYAFTQVLKNSIKDYKKEIIKYHTKINTSDFSFTPLHPSQYNNHYFGEQTNQDYVYIKHYLNNRFKPLRYYYLQLRNSIGRLIRAHKQYDR